MVKSKNFILILSACILFSCGAKKDNNSSIQTEDDTCEAIDTLNLSNKKIKRKMKESVFAFNDCVAMLNQYNDEKNLDNFLKLSEEFAKLDIDYSDITTTETDDEYLKEIKSNNDSLKQVIEKKLKEDLQNYDVPIIEQKDRLIQGCYKLPFYAERGDEYNLDIVSQDKYSIRLMNVDSKRVLFSSNMSTNIKRDLKISNSAIYVLEIKSKSPIYIDILLNKRPHAIEDFSTKAPKVTVDTVECRSQDFMSQSVKGIKMKNIFEEPKKITLRSHFKSMFSGSSRSIVAINIPANASDIMYSLRISSKEQSTSEDGQFFDRTSRRYQKIKFLGFSMYESEKEDNSLMRELLSAYAPEKEEDAYCDLYVFKNVSEARKFQDGSTISKVKYNMDYSTVGTQSCNGRIPVKGMKTLYLGFENPRTTSSVYLWLDVISTCHTTEYFQEKYSVIKK